LWWWLKQIYDCTKKVAARRVCGLLELVRDVHHHHQAPILDFVKERTVPTAVHVPLSHPQLLTRAVDYQLTNKWRKGRTCEGQLALADFILHMLWKHCVRTEPCHDTIPRIFALCSALTTSLPWRLLTHT
jgi:hypothetical protein